MGPCHALYVFLSWLSKIPYTVNICIRRRSNMGGSTVRVLSLLACCATILSQSGANPFSLLLLFLLWFTRFSNLYCVKVKNRYSECTTNGQITSTHLHIIIIICIIMMILQRYFSPATILCSMYVYYQYYITRLGALCSTWWAITKGGGGDIYSSSAALMVNQLTDNKILTPVKKCIFLRRRCVFSIRGLTVTPPKQLHYSGTL